MSTYIPVWKRSPNRFIKYEERSFILPSDCNGTILSGVETIALFLDKNGKEQTMQAYIKWDKYIQY